MKSWRSITVGFIVGLLLCSAIWGILFLRLQTTYARNYVSLEYGFAKHSERVLEYFDNPQTNQIRALTFGSSNVISSYISSIDNWDHTYPLVPLRKLHPTWYESERNRFEAFLKRASIVEPDGAANGSQPIRSQTNSTPSAAGSRR
jgi:hypothetical protein